VRESGIACMMGGIGWRKASYSLDVAASWVLRCASYSALEMLLKMGEEDRVMVVLVT